MYRRLLMLGAVLYLLMATSVASAQGVLDGEQCHVPLDMTVQGDLFAFCGELAVEGRVTGSIIGGARSASITGQVDGSVYLFGGELTVAGGIGKDVHYAGLVLKIEETTQFMSENGSVLSLSLSNTLQAGSVLPGSITDVGYQLVVEGDVGGEVNFWGSRLDLQGTVGQDVTATVGDSESGGASTQIETLLIPFQVDVQLLDPGLTVRESAAVDGQLLYHSPTQGEINAELENAPIFESTQDPLIIGDTAAASAQTVSRFLRVVWREFTSLAFVGLLCVVLIPGLIQAPIRTIQLYPISMLGVGLLTFILSFPVVLIFILLSVLLIVLLLALQLDTVILFLAAVLGMANVGGAGIFYFVAIYIARVVVGLALGRFVLRVVFKARDDGTWRFLLVSMLIGVLVLSSAGSLPFVGFGINAVALFLGLGAILTLLRTQYVNFRTTTEKPRPVPAVYGPDFLPRLPYLPDEAVNFPPPLINDEVPEAGMENLPDGFNWWQSDQAGEE